MITIALHKPSEIPKLNEISGRKELTPEKNHDIPQILHSVGEFDRKKVSKNVLFQLSQTEPYYPIILVKESCLLLAENSKKFKGLIWISGWITVESAYKDKNNIYYVRLKINGKSVDVNYDMLYPKDITKLSRNGLILNFDYANHLSKYLFRCIARLDVQEQQDGMGFLMQEGKLIFRAYDEEPEILRYTKNFTQSAYIAELNQLLTNSAIMFALCCSCASLFLAYLSMKCSIPPSSFIVSFYGKSTIGKSTAQSLMTSVYTSPKDKKIYIPFFGTLKQKYENCRNLMRNAIDDVESFDLAERLINEYAVILLAGKVLDDFGVTIDIDGITDIMTEHCSILRDRTDIAKKYYQHLVEYSILHPYAEGMNAECLNSNCCIR